MRNTFSVRFYCRQSNVRKDGYAPVEISVIVCGKREMWQLPKKCKPDNFNDDKDIQQYVTAVENRINQIHTNLVINNEAVSAYKIKDIFLNGNSAKSYTLKNLFDDGLQMKALDNGDISTYNKYKNVVKLFYEFTGHNENNEANAVTYADIMKFKIKIEAIHQPQTVFKEMQHLKYYFNLAFQSGKIKAHPFGSMKIKHNEQDKAFLTQAELKRLAALPIANDRQDKVRDIFLFLAGTGIEWADLISLKKEDVKLNDNGQYYIKKPRVKTGITYTTILTPDAVLIWEEYDGELPLISPQKFNKYIKELAKAAKIDKNVTSLTARHTFACYLLNERKLSIEVVSKMLGHSSIKETQHYSKLLDNSVFEANAGGQDTIPISSPKKHKAPEITAEMEDTEVFEKLLGIKNEEV